MPELPEVETIARGLDKRLAGDRIESVWIGSKPEPLASPAAEIERLLSGARILRFRRVGKHLVCDLHPSKPTAGSPGTPLHPSKPTAGSPGTPLHPNKPTAGSPGTPLQRDSALGSGATAQWIIHLGMTGRCVVCSPEAPRAMHTHLIATLASGRELRFVDTRRFGRLRVLEGRQFAAPGDEPTTAGRERFVQLFKKRKTPIKSALLNQSLLAGVGNIYADESLFRAGVRPRRQAARLTRAELVRLYDALQQVLGEAIAAGGSSVSDYVDADGESGFFQLQHKVYQRTGEPCTACGASIQRVIVAGRSSHYCPRCQK